MKNIFKVLLIASLVFVVAISASAAKITYDLVPYDEESGWYEVTFTVNMEFEETLDPASVVNTVEQYVSFDPKKLVLADTDYNTITDYSTACISPVYPYAVYTSGRNSYYYTIADPYDNDGNSLSWVEQDDGTVQGWITAYWSLSYELDTNDLLIGSIAFKLADGVTVDDLDSDDFVVDMIYLKDTNYGSYGYNCEGYTTTDYSLTVVNNVVPEASAITITVAEGDKVYLGSTVLAEITAETAGEYDVTEYAGKYVTVNTGYTAQKTYYIGTSAELVHENGVVSVNEQGIRGPKATDEADYGEDRSGLRFKMNHGTAGRTVENHKIVEVGFVMTAESAKILGLVGENYVLDMSMVNKGYAAYGYAYNPTAGRDFAYDSSDDLNYIITGVFYNIPLTQAGVQTTIASRPYYKVGDTYVYGEIVKTTLYDKAAAIKADTEAFDALDEDQQDYINNIVGLVDGWAEIVEEEVIIDVSGLYA